MNRVIVFIDVVGSVDEKVRLGDAEGQRRSRQRLADIEAALRAIDATIQRNAPPAGDEILLTGTNAVGIYHQCVLLQSNWKSWDWPHVPAVRIAIGAGEFEAKTDGNYTALSGSPIDLTHRFLEHCPVAGIVMTEGVRPALQSAGFAYKLERREATIQGFGRESYYVSNGQYIEGDVVIGKGMVLPVPMVVTGAISGSVPQLHHAPPLYTGAQWAVLLLTASTTLTALIIAGRLFRLW